MKAKLLVLIAAGICVGCSITEDDDANNGGSFSSGIPQLEATLVAATPSGLTSVSTASVQPFGTCGLSGSSTSSDILSCFQDEIFATLDDPSDNGSLMDTAFMKHIYEVDNRIGNLESRFEEAPDCFSDTSTEFPITLDIGGQTASFSLYLSCYEEHSTPDSTTSQDMAVGQGSDDTWYLVLRTTYGTTSGRILLASTDSDGEDVQVWMMSFYDDDEDDTLDTPGAGSEGSDDVNILRLLATKSSTTFTYNRASYNYNNNDFVELNMRSDGSNLQISSIRTADGASSVSNNPFTNSGCVSAEDVTAAGSDCSSLTSVPTDFGLSSAFTEDDMDDTTLNEVKKFWLSSFSIDQLGSMTSSDSEE